MTDDIPPLPLNKTVVEVLADFLAYLLECASIYIRETHANGADLWASVEDQIHFVLSHSNGWEGPQGSGYTTKHPGGVADHHWTQHPSDLWDDLGRLDDVSLKWGLL